MTTTLRAMLGETRLPRRAPGLPGDGVSVAPPVVASFAATEPAPALAPEPAPDSRDAAAASLSGRPRGERVSRRARIAAAAGLVLGALAITLYLTFGVADTVRIGAIYTLTGDGESAGNESLRGVKLAVDYLNDDGYPDLNLSLKPGAGLPGLGGAKLELASRDVGGDRCRVQSVFEQLVIDGAAAVVGAYESTITQQAVVAANKLEVPLVNDTATSFGLTANDDNGKVPRTVCDQVQEDPTPSDWFFRVGGNDQQFAELFGKLIAAERRRGHSIDEVAVLYEGHDSFGSSGFRATLKVANELGVKTTPLKYLRAIKGDERQATPGCAKRRLVQDLHARVARLQRDRPDVVFALSYLDDAALVVQTMATRGYRPPAMLVYGAGYANPEFVERARAGKRGCGLDAAKPDGIISRSSGGWPTRGAAELKVARMFKQRWGASITDTTARSFTATIALATAINAAGSTDPTRIRDAMRGLDISADQTILPDHGITFDPRGQNEGALAVLEQMVGGRYVTVYPPRESRRRVRWPLRKGFGM